jgi:hypothetical protein
MLGRLYIIALPSHHQSARLPISIIQSRLRFALPFCSPGGPRHAYSSSPYNGCTSSTLSPAPKRTLTPPAAPPEPLLVHRVRFVVSCSNACARCRARLQILLVAPARWSCGRRLSVSLQFHLDALLSSLYRYHHLFQSRYLDIVNAWCDQRSI